MNNWVLFLYFRDQTCTAYSTRVLPASFIVIGLFPASCIQSSTPEIRTSCYRCFTPKYAMPGVFCIVDNDDANSLVFHAVMSLRILHTLMLALKYMTLSLSTMKYIFHLWDHKAIFSKSFWMNSRVFRDECSFSIFVSSTNYELSQFSKWYMLQRGCDPLLSIMILHW